MVHWFLDATPEERRLTLDHAQDEVKFAAEEAVRRFKARKEDPWRNQYKYMKADGLFCVPLVKHEGRQGRTTVEFSRDGGPRPHTYLNPLSLMVHPDSTDRFKLVCLSRPLAKWVLAKHSVNLRAVPPALSEQCEWTSEEQKAWDGFKLMAMSINSRIDNANYRRSIMTRNDAA